MLDNGEFATWLELMTNDIVYEMPTRTSVMPKEDGLPGSLLCGKPFR
jgi:3-phenylpropionate/cinnamic acid dioxygenase small subunit